MMKALFVLKILNFCPDFLGHVEKRRDNKITINLKVHDVTNWLTNKFNTLTV